MNNVDELKKTLEVLSSELPTDFTLDMGRWLVKEECETVGCFIGLNLIVNPDTELRVTKAVGPKYNGLYSYEAIAEYFGITPTESYELFGSGSYSHKDPTAEIIYEIVKRVSDFISKKEYQTLCSYVLEEFIEENV